MENESPTVMVIFCMIMFRDAPDDKKYANDPSKSEKPMGIQNAIRTINTAAIAAITRTPPFPVFLLL